MPFTPSLFPPSLHSGRSHSSNDIIGDYENEMTHNSDEDGPRQELPAIDVAPAAPGSNTTSSTTANLLSPDTQGQHRHSRELPMVAWKSDSALEISPKKKRQKEVDGSRVAGGDSTHAEVVMRRKRLPCTMS